MLIAQSKVTAQGQISVPRDVRRKLGIGPDSVLEWEDEGNKMVVRRAGRFSSEDIHRELFGAKAPQPRSLSELKEAIAQTGQRCYGFKFKYCGTPSSATPNAVASAIFAPL